MKNVILLTALLFIGIINVLAQTGDSEVHKEEDGFEWNLLYKSSLCGAQTVDGKTIVPVEKKCKEIKYDNGVFICKATDDVCCVYSKDGEEIVSTSYNYYNISVDAWTKTYLSCVKRNAGDNKASLHDLNGKLIFPTGTYSNITPKKVNNKIYFIVSKDGKSQVLDYDHNLLISIDSPCFVSDIYEDKFGIYYGILQHDIERNVGIVDEKGRVVIAPGRYDLIKRVVNDRVAFYETTIIKGDKYPNQEFLHGVCDLEGHEVLPNEYSYCPFSSTEIFEMEKGGMTYKINIAQLIADAKAQRDRTLAYAHDATNTHNDNQNTADDFEAKRANIAERIDELAKKIQALQAKMGSNRQSTQNIASTSPSSYSIPSSSNNSFAPPSSSSYSSNTNNSFAPSSSSSYSSNTNSKYKALSDPNLVDNSEKIKEHENIIKELEYKKQHCYLCHGTGKTQKNCTMCFLGWSGYGKYKHPCTFCSGTGKVDDYCFECRNTNIAISATEHYLKSLKETHGMTKETAAFYYEHNSKMAQMDRDYQNTINAIAEPYLNSTRKSNSSNSSTNSSSKCSICNGTGIDPHTYYSGDPKPAVGGYTHSSGGKCVYCGKYEWHQHVCCPKCNANKYP